MVIGVSIPPFSAITYSSVGGAAIFTHPLRPSTWRNGQKVGEEVKAQGY